MARTNPFRFSTKYQDDETDLLYYGYRYYNASTGRWLSRDPMDEEVGSLNLYSACDNDVFNSFDPYGLQKFDFEIAHGRRSLLGEGKLGVAFGEITWGEPPERFQGSSLTRGPLSASTTLIGTGPNSGYCCNTPHNPKYADNLHGGSITVYMEGASKGTYEVTLKMKGSASIDVTEHDNEDPYADAGATLKFFATGHGQVLFGQVVGKGSGAKQSWADSSTTVVRVKVKRKSERVEIGSYDVQMALDLCPRVKVTAEGTVEVGTVSMVK